MEYGMGPEELQDVFRVETPAQWKALSHPLRLGILRLLREKAMTNEELAHSLGTASGKLYFHTRQLLDAGLIRLVGTRQKRAITEKLYRATAKNALAVPPLDDQGRPDLSDSIENATRLYQHTLREYPELFSPDRHVATHNLVTLAPHKAEEILRGLRSLVQEAMESATAEPDGVPIALTTLLHPLPGPARATEENRPAQDHEEIDAR
jgi:DNA-binding transcriptional ArsR family regulator